MRTPSVPTFFLLRAALLGATALVLVDLPAAHARVGVTSATDGDPLGKPPTEAERVLRIGVDVQANELITTRTNDRAHLLFLDGTSLTVGPNAQLTIDRYVFDPNTKTGDLAISATKGVFRLVGGKISKTQPVTVTTPASTIGIRGGIALLDVDSAQTTSTFVFGRDMTVSGAGRTEKVTRPGSQVVTSLGRVPGAPVLVPVGSLDGVLAQLEGNPRPSANQAARANSVASAEQKAQTSGFVRQNSGQGAAPSVPTGPKALPGLGRGPDNLQSQVANALSNRNTALENQVAEARETQIASVSPPGPNVTPTVPPSVTPTVPPIVTPTVPPIVPPTVPPTVPPVVTPNPTPTPTPTPAPTVIVAHGRFLEDPPYSSFDRSSIAAPRNPANNQPLAYRTVEGAVATVTTADGRTFVVPWRPGERFTFNGVTALGNGPANGFVSPNGDFFAYVFDANGKTFGFFGGTPTTQADFPKSGFGAHSVTAINEPGRLPFADEPVATDPQLKAAANISPIYSAYSPQLGTGVPNGVPANQRSVSLQVTVAIAGEGAGQKSYLGQYIGTYYSDYNSNSYGNSGGHQAIYRMPGQAYPGRFASSQSTAETGQGNAIYGPNGQYMVFVPESTDSVGNGTTGTTTRIPQAAQNLPDWANTSATPYYPVTVAAPTSAPSDLGETRTTRTMNGYVGGVIERIATPRFGLATSTRLIDVSASQPTDVRLSTDAATNRAQASIVVRNLDAQGVTATFELGSISVARSGSSSAFIDDKRYGLRDHLFEPTTRISRVQTSATAAPIPVWGRTQMTSYEAAPVPLPGGVTPCECAFMSWGWWTGEVQYFNPNNPSTGYNLSVKDRLNLASYVVGTLTNVVDLPRIGTATYTGHAVGNVANGASSYVAAGTYSNSWNFASQTGRVSIGNFDGATYTGTTTLRQGTVNFNGPIAGAGRTGNLNGSFFSSPGDPTKYQGGNFGVSGPNYKAGGIFAGQKP